MSCVNMKNIIKKIALFWATIAPGIFLVGYNIGTGSITTMGIGSFLLVYVCLNNCFFALYYNYRKNCII